MPSLLITDTEFQTLPEDCRKVLLARFMPGAEAASEAASEDDGQPAATAAAPGDEPPDLSPAQAKKAYAAFADRTKEVIRAIVSYSESGFLLADLEKALNAQPGGLKGSWAGITKVTRRILGDDEALLIWWTQNQDGSWHGRLSPMTYRSFRKVIGIV